MVDSYSCHEIEWFLHLSYVANTFLNGQNYYPEGIFHFCLIEGSQYKKGIGTASFCSEAYFEV
jgi:hypothetical protein